MGPTDPSKAARFLGSTDPNKAIMSLHLAKPEHIKESKLKEEKPKEN